MKIIKGKFKHYSLVVPKNIRPAYFRLRKALFDLLGEEILEKRVLDLFSGSGALGIEAFSCGAKEVYFVDLKKGCIRAIEMNLSYLKLLPFSHIVLKDAFKAIKDFYIRGEKFDIVFIDPPYYKGMGKKSLQTIDEYDILNFYGYVVVLANFKEDFTDNYKNFKLLIRKSYGQSAIYIYRKNE
ncbi:MAG: 16S rRNA (guanine(966)-N(2))-methyltransferase RsmD [Candidatus Omnitrophica bacterium]|nr:16S rRNA (guanine(966)-N(2))-methyltransferase RsmD [Candidatus Omnitrophota bacterium]